MGQYLNVSFTGATPDIPEGQVTWNGKSNKVPLNANLTETAAAILEEALGGAGLSKSAFLESVALHSGDILGGDPRVNSVIATAREVHRVRIDRGRIERAATIAAANGSS